VLRIFFALIATQLLAVTGLLLAGGILLLWVSWKMWRELREGHAAEQLASSEALTGRDLNAPTERLQEACRARPLRRRRGRS
jgi:predicted tellurium resistance membrane protein TerC